MENSGRQFIYPCEIQKKNLESQSHLRQHKSEHNLLKEMPVFGP